MVQQYRLKDYENIGIELNYSNKLGQPSTICGVLTFVSKDSVIVMDCYKKEHIVKRDGIKNFKPIRYGKKVNLTISRNLIKFAAWQITSK